MSIYPHGEQEIHASHTNATKKIDQPNRNDDHQQPAPRCKASLIFVGVRGLLSGIRRGLGQLVELLYRSSHSEGPVVILIDLVWPAQGKKAALNNWILGGGGLLDLGLGARDRPLQSSYKARYKNQDAVVILGLSEFSHHGCLYAN